MARDGSGTFNRTDGTRSGTTVWTKAKNAGVKIISVDHDTHDQDIADALTQSVSKDGQTPMTGDLNFGGNEITNYGSLAQTVSVPIFVNTAPVFGSGAYTYTTQSGQVMTFGKLVWMNYSINATVTTQTGNLTMVAPYNPNLESAVTVGLCSLGGTGEDVGDVVATIDTLGKINFYDKTGTAIPVPVATSVITLNISAVYRVA